MFLDNPQVVVVLVQVGGDLGRDGRENSITVSTAGHRTLNDKLTSLKPLSESPAINPRGHVFQ